jgi:hypothetical protein
MRFRTRRSAAIHRQNRNLAYKTSVVAMLKDATRSQEIAAAAVESVRSLKAKEGMP